MYANRARTFITLDEFDNKVDLIDRIERLEYGNGGNTNTSGGIRQMMNHAFSVDNGHRDSE